MKGSLISPRRWILRSLSYHWRVHVSVMLAVAVAVAVLTGALVVGDSVRGSLRSLALDGLGRVSDVVQSSRFFREEVANALRNDNEFQAAFHRVAPILQLSGALEYHAAASAAKESGETTIRRVGEIEVIGCDRAFWEFRLSETAPNVPNLGDWPSFKNVLKKNKGESNRATQGEPKQDWLCLTASVAKELGVQQGDEILLRIPLADNVPAESLLGEKEDVVTSARLRVGAILPDAGLANFRLSPSQSQPRNVFVPLPTLQAMRDASGKINRLFLEAKLDNKQGEKNAKERSEFTLAMLEKHLELQDYGIEVRAIVRDANGKLTQQATGKATPTYYNITTDAMVLQEAFVADALNQLKQWHISPAITYLANRIEVKDRSIPYSLVTGIDSSLETGGPLLDEHGKPLRLRENEIVLNDWAAKELNATVGDEVTLRYYMPESSHSELQEAPPAVFRLRAIVPLVSENGVYAPAADPFLTPQLKGVTDKKTIRDWDLPFPLVEKIRPQDDQYWEEYSTTPKAFVSFAAARKLWASRFGVVTSLRCFPKAEPPQAGSEKQEEAPSVGYNNLVRGLASVRKQGFVAIPLRTQLETAASGTTPFDLLFLGFSMFLIVSAIMLIALLFQLSVQTRAKEIGLLMAVGIPSAKIGRLLFREALLIAIAGTCLGVLMGVAYAWLMLAALRTVWLQAIVTPFLSLHVAWPTLVVGGVCGLIAALFPCWLTIRKLQRVSPRGLLAGSISSAQSAKQALPLENNASSGKDDSSKRRWKPRVALGTLVLAIGLSLFGFGQSGEAQAGAFFGAGALTLTAIMLLFQVWLNRPADANIKSLSQNPMARKQRPGKVAEQKGFGTGSKTFSLFQLAKQSAQRNPTRSLLSLGLVASASFLLIAISTFRLGEDDAGTGGFALLAKSAVPILQNLNTSQGRQSLGFSDALDAKLASTSIHCFRVKEGDDASCLNMYQPARPQILGVPKSLATESHFAWAGALALQKEEEPSRSNWNLLETKRQKNDNGNAAIPVILDNDTAMYSLHLGGVGSQFTLELPGAGRVTFEIVGLLAKSMLQGSLLISEENFLHLFPKEPGYRFFLIATKRPSNLQETKKAVATRKHVNEKNETASLRKLSDLLETELGDYGFDTELSAARLAKLYAVQNTYLSTFQSLGGLGLLLGTFGLAMVQLRSVIERRAELALFRAIGFSGNRLIALIFLEHGTLLVTGLAAGCIAALVAVLPYQWASGTPLAWLSLLAMLVGILLFGLVAGSIAARRAASTPLRLTLEEG